ncbi:hypothetical protein F1880_010067 [Penicillium rolfsii]|nr:hypothetical protein F1880_010067 [Penicillium rolfsii]
MRQMRKTDIHEILGISNNFNEQNQTRELVGTLMTENNVWSFNSYDSRCTFKSALIKELISPQTRLCPTVLTAYVLDADNCINALYGLARLIRKSRGPRSPTLSPNTPTSIPKSLPLSVSRAPSTSASAAITPAPTFPPACTAIAIAAPTLTQTHTPTIAATATTASKMARSTFNFNTINMTSSDINFDLSTLHVDSMTPSLSASTVTSDESITGPSTPENDNKSWIPDSTIWFLDLTNKPFGRALEFRFSDLVGLPMIQTAQLLESKWVDSSALLFIRFANALSQGLQVSMTDLTKIEIWMWIESSIAKTPFVITVPIDEGSMKNLEDAYHTILDEAMEHAFNGVLPLMDSLDAYDLTRSLFLGE